MADDWASVAAEVAAAIAGVGVALTLQTPTITGPVTPWDTTPAGPSLTYTIYAVPDMQRVRDASRTLTGETREMLMVSATGVIPTKADRVQVRGTWREIAEVRTLWHGGVDLMYELELVR